MGGIYFIYIDIIQDDVASWMRIVYHIFDVAKKEDEKARLKKVWNTWKEFKDKISGYFITNYLINLSIVCWVCIVPQRHGVVCSPTLHSH